MEIERERHEHPASFPLVMMYKKRWGEGKEAGFHRHDWFEFVYVHEGAGTFFIQKEFIDMRPGDVFTIPGDTIHRATTNSGHPYKATVIIFDRSLFHQLPLGESFTFLDVFRENAKNGTFKMAVTEETGYLIESALEEMHNELAGGRSGHRHFVLALLYQILIRLVRIQEMDPGHAPRQASPSKNQIWMRDILNYIDSHLNDSLSLSVLSGHCLVGATHFSRVFKQSTGFTLPEYLNMRRIQQAREKLLNTDYPVAFISELCGYESLSHFHRTFRKHTGLTPGQYRNRRHPPETN